MKLGFTPNFTPDIQLGHIVQAFALIVTIGGAVLAGYETLKAELAGQAIRISLVEFSIKTAETRDAQWRTEIRDAAVIMNKSLQDLTREITDLRLQNARQERK